MEVKATHVFFRDKKALSLTILKVDSNKEKGNAHSILLLVKWIEKIENKFDFMDNTYNVSLNTTEAGSILSLLNDRIYTEANPKYMLQFIHSAEKSKSNIGKIVYINSGEEQRYKTPDVYEPFLITSCIIDRQSRSFKFSAGELPIIEKILTLFINLSITNVKKLESTYNKSYGNKKSYNNTNVNTNRKNSRTSRRSNSRHAPLQNNNSTHVDNDNFIDDEY